MGPDRRWVLCGLRRGSARRSSELIAGLGLLAALSACGGSSDEPTPAEEARATAAEYQKALADGNAARACELTYVDLPGSGRDRPLEKDELKGCTRDGGRSLRENPLEFDPEVGKVRVRARTATAEVRAPKGSPREQLPRRRLELRRFDDDWKVSFKPN